MSLFLASLNSGSNGNCYYLGNKHDAVLIDAGISCRETLKRMARLGLLPGRVRAIFISHEHSDHTRGTETLARKLNVPVFISPATYLKCKVHIDKELLRTFKAHEQIMVESLTIKTFPKLHDGIDPCSFTVSHEGVTVGIFTDIGEACPNVIHHFGQCHAAFLEANYDETMLEEGNYPPYLKRRIRSREGHLSNIQALGLFQQHKAPFLSHLILSHLSEQNNHPGIVENLFTAHAKGTHIAIASRYRETGVFRVTGK